MCTLSLIRAPFVECDAEQDLRWRVMFNRDERRTRAEALPPRIHTYGATTAIHPVDPEGLGTWIAATDAGLVFALLNHTEVPLDAVEILQPVSRGWVIPRLLDAASLDEVASRVDELPSGIWLPFRLVVVSDAGALEVLDTGGRRHVNRHPAEAVFMRTSSSVAPVSVRQLRSRLFAELVPRASLEAQAAFHRHRWPDASGASVLMSRVDAATVSTAVVDAFAGGLRVAYRRWPGGAADVTELPRAA